MWNFLEQLVAEWLEYRGYFVRRNVRVGPRQLGGFEGELDVVAWNPGRNLLAHVETSMDAWTWEVRNAKFEKKFARGRMHGRQLFGTAAKTADFKQEVLFGWGGTATIPQIGGGRVVMLPPFMRRIGHEMQTGVKSGRTVPEQFLLLRSLQFAAKSWKPESLRSVPIDPDSVLLS